MPKAMVVHCKFLYQPCHCPDIRPRFFQQMEHGFPMDDWNFFQQPVIDGPAVRLWGIAQAPKGEPVQNILRRNVTGKVPVKQLPFLPLVPDMAKQAMEDAVEITAVHKDAAAFVLVG